MVRQDEQNPFGAGVVSHSRFLVVGSVPSEILVVSMHYLKQDVQDHVEHFGIQGPMYVLLQTWLAPL